MTNEELDRARAIEAHKRISKSSVSFEYLDNSAKEERILAAKLAREGWMPVDPKLIRAREIVAKEVAYPEDIIKGLWDNTPIIKAVLVALNEK